MVPTSKKTGRRTTAFFALSTKRNWREPWQHAIKSCLLFLNCHSLELDSCLELMKERRTVVFVKSSLFESHARLKFQSNIGCFGGKESLEYDSRQRLQNKVKESLWIQLFLTKVLCQYWGNIETKGEKIRGCSLVLNQVNINLVSSWGIMRSSSGHQFSDFEKWSPTLRGKSFRYVIFGREKNPLSVIGSKKWLPEERNCNLEPSSQDVPPFPPQSHEKTYFKKPHNRFLLQEIHRIRRIDHLNQRHSILKFNLTQRKVKTIDGAVIVFFFFSVPPSISILNSGNTLSVRKDSPVSLACNASGFPQPRIIWQREVSNSLRWLAIANDHWTGKS